MKRILFVDDDARVLSGLRNLLRSQRREWEMIFATNGDAAVRRMEDQDFDVVVTDMRMPGLDGAGVLEWVQTHQPGAARIVLSGYSETESVLRSVPIAHQFLAKPCEPEVLKGVIERALNLQVLVSNANLKRLVGSVESLPPLPRLYEKLNRMLASEETGIADVSDLLKQDMAMSAKILQLVNSAFFTTGMEITDVEFAVSRLGFETVRSLVLAAEVFGTQHESTIPGFSYADLQHHALLTGQLASTLAGPGPFSDDAFIAGVLHDIGKLVMAAKMPDEFQRMNDEANGNAEPSCVTEYRSLGVCHAEIGAYLLGLWGLPYQVVESVANHHRPGRVSGESPDVVTFVHVANALAHGCSRGDERLDARYLDAIGCVDQLPRWREFASEVLTANESRGA